MTKIIVITGATSGIGLETAKAFIREYGKEVQIISISRNVQRIEQAKKELPGADFYSCDVSEFSQLEKTAEQIEKKYGKIDVLVNNAGSENRGGVESVTAADWDSAIRNNLSSVFYTTKLFVPLLKKSDFPSIINISSVSGKMGGSSIAYGVAKAGIDLFTRRTARELAKYKIRVNTVSPGIVTTGFQMRDGAMSAEQYKDFLKNRESGFPLGLGEAADVAGVVVFLAGEKARWITGADFVVDGGRLVNA